MKLSAQRVLLGQHYDRQVKVIKGMEGQVELTINIENGNGILSINHGSYVEHHNIHNEKLLVVITGGDMDETEYEFVNMPVKAIYEVIRDGFTVELSGIQKFQDVDGQEINLY